MAFFYGNSYVPVVYLRNNRSEALSVSMYEYDEKRTVHQMGEEAFEDGVEQGIERGIEQEKRKGRPCPDARRQFPLFCVTDP